MIKKDELFTGLLKKTFSTLLFVGYLFKDGWFCNQNKYSKTNKKNGFYYDRKW